MPAPKRQTPKTQTSRKQAKKKPQPKPQQTRACSRCGTTEPCPDGGIPIGWTFSVENKRTDYICVACARMNLRAIEGRLPEEYWS